MKLVSSTTFYPSIETRAMLPFSTANLPREIDPVTLKVIAKAALAILCIPFTLALDAISYFRTRHAIDELRKETNPIKYAKILGKMAFWKKTTLIVNIDSIDRSLRIKNNWVLNKLDSLTRTNLHRVTMKINGKIFSDSKFLEGIISEIEKNAIISNTFDQLLIQLHLADLPLNLPHLKKTDNIYDDSPRTPVSKRTIEALSYLNGSTFALALEPLTATLQNNPCKLSMTDPEGISQRSIELLRRKDGTFSIQFQTRFDLKIASFTGFSPAIAQIAIYGAIEVGDDDRLSLAKMTWQIIPVVPASQSLAATACIS